MPAMTQPTPYARSTSFAEDESSNVGGRSTVRTARVDAELDAISTTLAGTLTNLKLIQRDDGKLRDATVELHTLSSAVLALLSAAGVVPRGPWVTSTSYSSKDLVSQSGNTYICVSAHTSGTFATDFAANRWLLFTLGSAIGAASVSFTPTANISASNVQAAIEEADTEGRALSALQVAAISDALSDTTSTSNGDALIGVKLNATGAVARTQHDKNAERVSVLDFGAVPDGNYATGAGTDNTAAFQAAINACSTSGGGVVFIPGGILGVANSSYKLASQITVPSGVVLVGAGKWASILFCPSTFSNSGGLIRFNGVGGNPGGMSGVAVLAQTGGAGGSGIVSVANGTFLRDLWVTGFTSGNGIQIGSTDNFLSDFAVEICLNGIYCSEANINIEHGTVYECTQGVVVTNNAAVGLGTVSLTGVRATECPQSGFIVSSGKNVSISNCSADHVNNGKFTVAGLLINGSTNVTVNNFVGKLGTVSTTAYGIKVLNSSNVSITGGLCSGWLDGLLAQTSAIVSIAGGNYVSNGRRGINLQQGEAYTVEGAICRNNGTGSANDAGIWSDNTWANGVDTLARPAHIIANNVCDQASGPGQDYGIYANCGASAYTILSGNLCALNGTADIALSGTPANIRLNGNIASVVTDTAPSAASAASLTLPVGADAIVVTGTTTITSISAAGNARRVVTLNFTGALTVTDGSNLKLAGNFVTTGDDTLTLYCDGTNWFEIARAVN